MKPVDDPKGKISYSYDYAWPEIPSLQWPHVNEFHRHLLVESLVKPMELPVLSNVTELYQVNCSFKAMKVKKRLKVSNIRLAISEQLLKNL